MNEKLDTAIERMPVGTLPADGPPLVLGPSAGRASASEFYRAHLGAPLDCAAPGPLAAVIRSDVLATPDRLMATGSRTEGRTFAIDLDVRRFEGPMAANDPWVALVRVELGQVEPGRYDLVVRTTLWHFDDRAHPESARNPESSIEHIRFDCA